MKIDLVIPAYNAEGTLADVMARIPASLEKSLHRIWIVNDGSGDGTGVVAAKLVARQPCIRVLSLAQNRGYGYAMKTGLIAAQAAGAEVVACLHADGQYAPESLPALLAALQAKKLDLLQGSRLAAGTALGGGMPLYKYLAGRALVQLENRVFGLQLTDYHSGYLLYGSKALRRIPFARLSDNFDFDLEVIACARARGLAIGELPIPTRYADEVSYLNPIAYGFRVLAVMWAYRIGKYNEVHP